MPSNTKKSIAAAATLPAIPKELIDQFVTGPMSAEAVNAASVASKKALIERALGGRVESPSGLPTRSRQARGRGQSSQRQERQDGADRR